MARLNFGLSVADVYLAVGPFAYIVARIEAKTSFQVNSGKNSQSPTGPGCIK